MVGRRVGGSARGWVRRSVRAWVGRHITHYGLTHSMLLHMAIWSSFASCAEASRSAAARRPSLLIRRSSSDSISACSWPTCAQAGL